MEAIRIFIAFATYMNFIVFQMDVKSAFLNGKLKEEVYVKHPPGFESSKFRDYVCKLDKALYGLKQAPRVWYETLSTFFIQNKFVRGRIDNTLFIYKSKGDVLLVQVYVDDISTSYKLCKQFEKLMTKKFEISMIRELTYFIGLSSVKTPMVPPNNLGPDLARKPAPVSHPSPEAVKAELAKLVENPILLDRIPVLKTTFPVAWRILLSNKSRQKYVSYPRFVSYALEVLLGSNYTQDESFGSSPNILSNSKVLNGPFKVTPIELTAFMVVVNNNEKSVTPLPFTVKKKKEKSQIVTSTLPQTQGPKTSGSL
ncbi:retrovirus-related pol polyprotein from transposon TNT 1-94 [Tanacetum coccineum]